MAGGGSIAKEDQIREHRELQDKQQKKTFSRWWKTYLVQNDRALVIKDLYEDIKPGVIGIKLMEVCQNATQTHNVGHHVTWAL